MYFSSMIIRVFTGSDAGKLPIRSAPVDHC